MTFQERLVQLRKENGFKTRNEFAEALGIPTTTLRNYEKGEREPGHTFLKRISEMFNVSIDYLLGLTENKEVLHEFRVTSKEQSMIGQYRTLDAFGTDMVDTVLEKEYIRCTAGEESSKVVEFTLERGSGKLVARNGRDLTQDDKDEILSIARRWKNEHSEE